MIDLHIIAATVHENVAKTHAILCCLVAPGREKSKQHVTRRKRTEETALSAHGIRVRHALVVMRDSILDKIG